MKETYVSITITYFSNHNMKPAVQYYKDDGTQVAFTIDELAVDEANLLMWKLIKLGGTNTYRANMFNNAISERNVTFWGKL